MAVLIPDAKGEGGKIIIEMVKEMEPESWDRFFVHLGEANQKLIDNPDDYIGITTKHGRIIEYWFANPGMRNTALGVLRQAVNAGGFEGKELVTTGYTFKLLFKGDDY